MPKMCDFTDRGDCAAKIAAACICVQPGYKSAKETIERLRALLTGVEIALARDEDIDGAMKLIVADREANSSLPTKETKP